MDEKEWGNFLIVTTEALWTYYINKSFECDFYHSWSYHDIDKRGKPLLFVYEEVDDFIAIPFLKREIVDSDFFDLTSAYGYTGPISNKKLTEVNPTLVLHFRTAFKVFLKNHNIISVFSRLHPFYNQNLLLQELGGVKSNGKTVYIDFSLSLEKQRENYDKRLLRQVKQLRKKSYLIKEGTTEEEIEAFTSIYQKNMDRLLAHSDYYYTTDYFKHLITNGNNCKLILIYDGNQVICGAIIGCSNSIIRNHLSATHADYVKESPSKLLTDEISVIGRTMGLNYFHLGGGVGGKEDSLFNFKSHFSNLFLEDHIWCYIANQEMYNLLVKQKNSENINSEFFPLYRAH